ncbi:ERCC4 domain-containing protein [Gordonia westfalica]|uniref:ERCC4 domain-containing protein n=1 Tax=Gordonia westfalica TaxID=158898 RepID=A0ABU2GQM9_9ACTN|nr:ERCC4 domain-containing protein [Gordonia westfalica]MDS1113054.1 ERCC4 domain-containing protein [Gordonia westfalica]
MIDDFVVARNPEEGSTLPYLVRIPLGPNGIVLKVRDTWPRATKIYCHRALEWPAEPEIVETHPVRSVLRRGAAIDLVLDRARENRSQFVLTRARGREMIFWQSRRTTKQARPNVALPTARAHGQALEIVVDSGEKYAYSFGHQQATTTRRRLTAGDYAIVEGDTVVAAVERKSIDDLAGGLMSGKFTYQLADLAGLHRAAVVVEAAYSKIFNHEHVAASPLAEAVAEAQVRFPSVPIVFCDNRKLAEEWTYRWLGAALHEWRLAVGTEAVVESLAGPEATPAQIRAWATAQGIEVPAKGRIPSAVRRAWEARNG